MIRAAVAALCVAGGCGRAPVRDCGDDLTGVWRTGAERWQLIEVRDRRELYPLFRDLPAVPAGVVAAPRVIRLPRTGDGTVTRRYERGDRFCSRTAPARLRACGAGGLTLELADPPPPDDWATCAGPPAPPLAVTLTR